MPQTSQRKRNWSQRGAAMLEMALILPIYFLLLYGIIQICFITFCYCNATFGVRVAARYATVHGTGSTYQCTSTDLQTIVKQYLWGAPKTNLAITTSWSPDNNPGSSVTIKVSMTFPTAIPFSQLSQISIGTAVTQTILR